MLTKNDRCFMCKRRLSEPIIIPHYISGAYAFHIESTHGIPKEYLADWINELLLQAYNTPPTHPPVYDLR